MVFKSKAKQGVALLLALLLIAGLTAGCSDSEKPDVSETSQTADDGEGVGGFEMEDTLFGDDDGPGGGNNSQDGDSGGSGGSGGNSGGNNSGGGKTPKETLIYATWSNDDKPGLGNSELGDAQYYAMQAAADKYNYKLKFKVASDLSTKMIQAKLSGTKYADVFRVHSDNYMEFVKKDIMADITAYMKGADDAKRFNTKIATFGGKVYGFDPVGSDVSMPSVWMVYNTALLKQLNLESPRSLEAKGQWNWDRFQKYCIAATQSGEEKRGVAWFGLQSLLFNSNGTMSPYVEVGGQYRNAYTHSSTAGKYIQSYDFMRKLARDDKVVSGLGNAGMDAVNKMYADWQKNNILFAYADGVHSQAFKKNGYKNYEPVMLPQGKNGLIKNYAISSYAFMGISPQTSYALDKVTGFMKEAYTVWNKDAGKAYYAGDKDKEADRLYTQMFEKKSDAEYLLGKGQEYSTQYLIPVAVGGIQAFEIDGPIMDGQQTPAQAFAATNGKIQTEIDKVFK